MARHDRKIGRPRFCHQPKDGDNHDPPPDPKPPPPKRPRPEPLPPLHAETPDALRCGAEACLLLRQVCRKDGPVHRRRKRFAGDVLMLSARLLAAVQTLQASLEEDLIGLEGGAE